MLTEQELNMIQAREKRFDYVEVGMMSILGRVKNGAKRAVRIAGRGTKKVVSKAGRGAKKAASKAGGGAKELFKRAAFGTKERKKIREILGKK